MGAKGAPGELEGITGATAITQDQRNQFLSCLRQPGGEAGNVSLRNALWWDEVTYNRVRDDLIADGQVIAGKGKGRSVALATG